MPTLCIFLLQCAAVLGIVCVFAGFGCLQPFSDWTGSGRDGTWTGISCEEG
jgi:hypothetical protein